MRRFTQSLALVLVLSAFTLTALGGEWTGYISDSKR